MSEIKKSLILKIASNSKKSQIQKILQSKNVFNSKNVFISKNVLNSKNVSNSEMSPKLQNDHYSKMTQI